MNRDKQIHIVKKAAILAVIFVLGLYAFFTYLQYKKQEDTFDNLNPMLAQILLDKQANLDTITEDDLKNYQKKKESKNDPPLDEQLDHNHDNLGITKNKGILKDPSNVVTYLFALAIYGEEEHFFLQFDPNTQMQDFPSIQIIRAEQHRLFSTITREGTLSNIKILKKQKDITDQSYIIDAELIYKDNTRKEVEVKLTAFYDEHSNESSPEWYIKTSVHQIVSMIKENKGEL